MGMTGVLCAHDLANRNLAHPVYIKMEGPLGPSTVCIVQEPSLQQSPSLQASPSTRRREHQALSSSIMTASSFTDVEKGAPGGVHIEFGPLTGTGPHHALPRMACLPHHIPPSLLPFPPQLLHAMLTHSPIPSLGLSHSAMHTHA